MKPVRPSLFRSLALGLAPVIAAIALLSAGIVAWRIAYPLAQRAVSDLGALMILSAQTWAELPPETRTDFELELIAAHGLLLVDADESLPVVPARRRYLALLERDMSRRLGESVAIHSTADPEWHWVDIPLEAGQIRIGFSHERVGTSPPAAALLLSAVILLFSLLTALALARRLARPLEELSAAAARIGAGETPQPLPERGPRELAELAAQLNRTALDVRSLLANRTTLLAGISHDLRTPLARMRLALEMLPAGADPELVAGLNRDVAELERLLKLSLEVGSRLEAGHREDVELGALLEALAEDARRAGMSIELDAPESTRCRLDRLALERVLGNLLDNAHRYSGARPVTLQLKCSEDSAEIAVLDRGPGIPAGELERVFQPFFRLEPSRSSVTGGAGLGLAIARQLAQANGWRLTLEARDGGGAAARLDVEASGSEPGPVR